jgi:hypothetical protein
MKPFSAPMDDNLKKKFEFVRSDIRCQDITELATRSDVESIACECIMRGSKVEGCNLLTEFGRLLEVNSSSKKLSESKTRSFMMVLDDAEKRLS